MAKRSREDFGPSSPDPRETDLESISDPSVNESNPTEATTGSVKIIHLDSGSGLEPSSISEMICSLPPHRQTLSFSSYEEYEIHYNKTHVNRCHGCRKNFPTDHFLILHIEEIHDALVSVRRERGEKTVCYYYSHSLNNWD